MIRQGDRAQANYRRSETLPIPPGSPVDQDVALNSSFPVVLMNLPSIVGCICGDNQRMILHIRDLKRFERRFIEPGIMDICWCNRAGKEGTIPIDKSTQLVPLYLLIAIIAGRSPFLA